jgi:hypothetical protein
MRRLLLCLGPVAGHALIALLAGCTPASESPPRGAEPGDAGTGSLTVGDAAQVDATGGDAAVDDAQPGDAATSDSASGDPGWLDAGCPAFVPENKVKYLPSGTCALPGQMCLYHAGLECPDYFDPTWHDQWRCVCDGGLWRCELAVHGMAACVPLIPDAGEDRGVSEGAADGGADGASHGPADASTD